MTIDFNQVKQEHEGIHGRLLNWARWCRGSNSGNVHPMFRQYRNGYFEATPTRNYSDTVDAVAMQRVMKDIPERQRIALQWFYVRPSDPRKICMTLAVSKADLVGLIDQGRAMAKNLVRDVAQAA